MAIQQINLGSAPSGAGGDTQRAANTKINENFTNPDHAASRLVGTTNGQIPLVEQIKQIPSGAIIDSGSSKTAQEISGKGLVYSCGKGAEIGVPDIGNTPISTLSYSPSMLNTHMEQIFTSGRLVLFNDRLHMQEVEYKDGGYQYKQVLTTYYSTANTAKEEGTGYLVASSPILKVQHDSFEKIHEAEQLDVDMQHLETGVYEFTGTTGLRENDGWNLKPPKDVNGNVLCICEATEKDGVITLNTYAKRFDFETVSIVADYDKPINIPEGATVMLRFNDLPREQLDEPIE